MKNLLILVLALLLALFAWDRAYGGSENVHKSPAVEDSTLNPTNMKIYGPDGYYFEGGNYTNEVSVTLIFHKNREDLQKSIDDPDVAAYTYTRKLKNGTLCEVHVVNPYKSYEPQYLGHEIFHCLFSNWHPSQGK